MLMCWPSTACRPFTKWTPKYQFISTICLCSSDSAVSNGTWVSYTAQFAIQSLSALVRTHGHVFHLSLCLAQPQLRSRTCRAQWQIRSTIDGLWYYEYKQQPKWRRSWRKERFVPMWVRLVIKLTSAVEAAPPPSPPPTHPVIISRSVAYNDASARWSTN